MSDLDLSGSRDRHLKKQIRNGLCGSGTEWYSHVTTDRDY